MALHGLVHGYFTIINYVDIDNWVFGVVYLHWKHTADT